MFIDNKANCISKERISIMQCTNVLLWRGLLETSFAVIQWCETYLIYGHGYENIKIINL